MTGVTPGGEYKVARQAEPRHDQAGRGWYVFPTITMPSPSGAEAFSGPRSAAPITMDLRATTERHHRADIDG